jgi:hypothetical protein
MLRDPELSALLDQAARNLDGLERLARTRDEDGITAITRLKERLEELKVAYKTETDALTQQVLKSAVERRITADRRRTFETQLV